MVESDKKIDVNFFQLVLSLQMAAMQQMGKIASPMTGKLERNLEQAQASIDLLTMLSEKTQNNLTKDEKDLLERVLFELKMNYIDESKKPAGEPQEKEKEASESEKAPETGGKEETDH